ncbi:MAG: AzlD domain-containing protein [Chloroflexota bacterium]
MNQFNLLIMIVLTAAVTFALRVSFILAAGRYDLPPVVRQILDYAPPAVLFALITPFLILSDGAADLSLGNNRLIAGVCAIICAWWTRNLFLTILIGMSILWGLNFLVG